MRWISLKARHNNGNELMMNDMVQPDLSWEFQDVLDTVYLV